jgi:hypothetical protein
VLRVLGESEVDPKFRLRRTRASLKIAVDSGVLRKHALTNFNESPQLSNIDHRPAGLTVQTEIGHWLSR